MDGYKFELGLPNGEIIPHWDEARNIEFDDAIALLGAGNVQQAIEKLKELFNGVTMPEITIDDETGNWKINGVVTEYSAQGITNIAFMWGRSTRSNVLPTSWSTVPTVPDSTNQYLWLRIDTTKQGTTVQGEPHILMVYQEGSGGASSNVKIVTDSATPTDTPDTLYFFLFSLLQGVGLYNNLLNGRNTDLEYKDNVLYSVNSAGYCDIVEPEGNIEIINNRVWCCGKPTTMWNKGKIVTQTIVYSVTSEYANLAFIVEGPFYAEETRVSITYDDTLIEVIRYPDSIEYNEYIEVVSEDVVFENIDSGDEIIVDSDKFYIPIKLRIKRKNFNPSDIVQSLSTAITLNNGYEETQVTVNFCETVLFYKDGVGYNGFDVDNIAMSRPSKVKNGTTYYSSAVNNAADGYINLLLNTYCASYMWIYNKRTRDENEKVYIDYSHTVELYFRLLRCSNDTRDMLRLISLSADPVTSGRACNSEYFPDDPGTRYFVPMGEDGTDKSGNVIHSPNMACMNYLKAWPSIDGAVISQTFPYSNIAAENSVLENDIGIGEVMYSRIYIAEIGIRKYNNIDLNGWDL